MIKKITEAILCQNIKTIRENNNLSKKKMAKIMGISPVTLSKIESGILPPNLNVSVLFIFQKKFSIDPGDILTQIL